MPYISNAKINYNLISPSFQYTQLQHFCPQIPQQRAGYSTSRTYIYRAGEYKEFNLICGVRAVTKCLYLFSFIIMVCSCAVILLVKIFQNAKCVSSKC